jgi:NlpE N-terminal domain
VPYAEQRKLSYIETHHTPNALTIERLALRLPSPFRFLADRRCRRHLSSFVMRVPAVKDGRPRFLFRLLPAFWLLSAFCAGAQPSPPSSTGIHITGLARRQQADILGIYQGHAPATDIEKRVFTLDLAADGTAVLTTLYIGKGDAAEHGRWTQTGSQIVLTFDPIGPNRPPGPISFRHRDHELSPIHWDLSEWGRGGPPILHRLRPKATSGGTLPASSASLFARGER